MAAAQHTLAKAVESIRGSGSFFMKGTVEFVFPGIALPGGEELAFPLPPSQARYIESIAESAPYGKGEATVTDASVRHCRQVDAEALRWSLPHWELLVSVLAERAAAELGVEGKVSAIPYKLLLYGKGGHFRAHRDSEKAPGMFGSLIVSLPCEHSGGELVVRHDGREESVSFADGNWREEIRYAAFYADCEHEVRPVRSGYRLCLAYHLVRKASSPPVTAPTVSAGAAMLREPLESLKTERPGELTAVLLEHAYTQDSFSVKALKGDDRARSHALFAAAEAAGFCAHLGLVSLYQMGELDNYGEDETMGEVFEESLTIEHWRTAADRKANPGRFEIPEDCLLGRKLLGEGEPSETYAEGYTGNAGCTMEYWYRRAAVVLWPIEADAVIRTRYDFDAAAEEFLKTARKKRKAAGKSSRFLDLGSTLVGTGLSRVALCEEESKYRRSRMIYQELVPVLEGIAHSRSDQLFHLIPKKIVRNILLAGNPSVMAATLDAFGSDAVAPVFSSIANEDPECQNRDSFFYLLDATLRRLPEQQDLAVAMASRLLDFVDEELAEERRQYRMSLSHRYFSGWDDEEEDLPLPHRIRLAIAATALMEDSIEREKIHERLRSGGRLRHLRKILAPALLHKEKKGTLPSLSMPNSLYRPLLEEAIEDLQKEVDSALEPYSDWTRPIPDPADEVPTDRFVRDSPDSLIRELKDFLRDPAAESHQFRHREAVRKMLESYIRHNQLDLDLRTEKKGTPYTLLCTKNHNSYRAAVAGRNDDRKLLEKLVALRKTQS